MWPALLDDSTQVVGSVPGVELLLHARAWPFGTAEIRIRLRERDGECEIEMIEHGISRPGSWIPDSLQDRAVYQRNRECLRRLALIAERATAPSAGDV